jgi:hypothetical protein
MVVSLNIENDIELRSYIKDLIRGQIKSFTQDELMTLITLEIEKKFNASNETWFNEIFKKAVEKAVEKLISSNFNIKSWNGSFIKPYIDNYLDVVFKNSRIDFEKAIADGVKEKIKKLL